MNAITKLNENLSIFYEFNSKINSKVKLKENSSYFNYPTLETENEKIKIEFERWKELNEIELFSFEQYLEWDVLSFTEKYKFWKKLKIEELIEEEEEREIEKVGKGIENKGNIEEEKKRNILIKSKIEQNRQKSILNLTLNLYQIVSKFQFNLMVFNNKCIIHSSIMI